MSTLEELLVRGWALVDSQEWRRAEEIARQTLAVHPQSAAAWACLGGALYGQRRLNEATDAYSRAVEFDSQMTVAWNNLGMIYTDLASLDRALESFDRGIANEPSCLTLWKNKAVAFLVAGRVDAALAFYEQALHNFPVDADLHMQSGMLRLLCGDFFRGLNEYEWRLAIEPKLPPVGGLVWDGSPLTGKRILLRPEQGIGDTIQFVRYAAALKCLGATVLFECPTAFFPLFKSCRSVDQLIGFDDELPLFDFHAPLLSLPRLLGTSLSSIPAEVPYLFAESGLVEQWRRKLESISGFRIGINWRGRVGPIESQQRDIPLSCVASLANVPNVRLISLQKGAAREELMAANGQGLQVADAWCFPSDLGMEVDSSRGAFMDTAAMMMNLDLIITSDTAIAHLAGALGVPVWLALPFVPDWRWLLVRNDSPWYPTMRLFRQKRPGDWNGVIEEINAALSGRIVR